MVVVILDIFNFVENRVQIIINYLGLNFFSTAIPDSNEWVRRSILISSWNVFALE